MDFYGAGYDMERVQCETYRKMSCGLLDLAPLVKKIKKRKKKSFFNLFT
jgi:hypothetical protein